MAINYEEIMSLEEKNLELSYSQRDSIIYSLGIGLGKDPMDTTELKYVYENGLIAFPSMATNFQYKSPLLLKAKLNMVINRIPVTRTPKIHSTQSTKKTLNSFDQTP